MQFYAEHDSCYFRKELHLICKDSILLSSLNSAFHCIVQYRLKACSHNQLHLDVFQKHAVIISMLTHCQLLFHWEACFLCLRFGPSLFRLCEWHKYYHSLAILLSHCLFLAPIAQWSHVYTFMLSWILHRAAWALPCPWHMTWTLYSGLTYNITEKITGLFPLISTPLLEMKQPEDITSRVLEAQVKLDSPRCFTWLESKSGPVWKPTTKILLKTTPAGYSTTYSPLLFFLLADLQKPTWPQVRCSLQNYIPKNHIDPT